MNNDEPQIAWTSSVLLQGCRDGDETAAEALYSRFVKRLTALARSRLSPRLSSRTDPEDIVQSVFRSFFVDARDGRFSLSRGGDLWRLLSAIAKHKLSRQVRHAAAFRRSLSRELSIEDVP